MYVTQKEVKVRRYNSANHKHSKNRNTIPTQKETPSSWSKCLSPTCCRVPSYHATHLKLLSYIRSEVRKYIPPHYLRRYYLRRQHNSTTRISLFRGISYDGLRAFSHDWLYIELVYILRYDRGNVDPAILFKRSTDSRLFTANTNTLQPSYDIRVLPWIALINTKVLSYLRTKVLVRNYTVRVLHRIRATYH